MNMLQEERMTCMAVRFMGRWDKKENFTYFHGQIEATEISREELDNLADKGDGCTLRLNEAFAGISHDPVGHGKVEIIRESDRSEYCYDLQTILSYPEKCDNLPANAPIIAQYLWQYRPAEADEYSPDYPTSQDIADSLADIVAVTIDDVAAVMMHCGVELCIVGPSPCWALSKE